MKFYRNSSKDLQYIRTRAVVDGRLQVAPLHRWGHGYVDRGRTVNRYRSDRSVNRSRPVDRFGAVEGGGVRVIADLHRGVADRLGRRPV